MATETSAADELEKKENEQESGEKSVSLNEEKHDKSQDVKVQVEKTEDSLATITAASGEDKKADVAVAEEPKTDDSPSLEACVEDNLKDPALISKEEVETGVTPQVSPHKEALVANEAESSPGIAENVVQEDCKNEPSAKDETEGVSKGWVGVLENPQRVFENQEAKTDDQQEEKQDSAAPSVEEKVAVNDDKKEGDARDVVERLSREADKVAIPEAEQDKLENVNNDQPAYIKKKEEHAKTKVDEITGAVSEPVRETLASKFEEKEEESITTSGVDKVNETVEEKTVDQITNPPTKETEAKPPLKQSNNILHKVKQSLLKAKKAITGKSPTSKTISSETKGDIQVK